MSRIIKFRAWDGQDLYYSDVYADGTNDDDLSGFFEQSVSNKDDTMQYTGNRDLNGEDIYEGDVLFIDSEIEHNPEETDTDGTVYEARDTKTDYYAVVFWDEDEGRWDLKGKVEEPWGMEEWDTYGVIEFEEWVKYRIVGNIYELPKFNKSPPNL